MNLIKGKQIDGIFDGISATTIGDSGTCVSDLYISNIHSCSPLLINPSDEGNIYFGSTSGFTYDVTNNRLGIGLDTPTARLHIEGAGSTNTTNALLIENSSGNDLLKIDDGGNVVFNESSIDADFRIEGSTDINLFNLNGGTDTIGFGAGPSTNYKIYINADSETRTRGLYVSATNMGNSSTGIFVNHSSTGAPIGLSVASNSTSGGAAKAIVGNANVSGSQNFGGWFSARNGTSKSVAIYGEVSTTNTEKGSTGTYVAQLVNGSTEDDSTKTGLYAGITQAPTGSTSYAMYSTTNDAGDDSTIYGNYVLNTVVNAARSGVTSTGLYIANYGGNSGNTYNGIVCGPHAGNDTPNSGFGTLTPSATVDIVGSLQYVDGNETDGYILTSDANGNATWMSGATGGGIACSDCTYAETITTGGPVGGPGAGATNTITHNLGTTNIQVQLWLASGDLTTARVTNRTTNSVDVIFAVAPNENVDVVVQS